MPLPPQAIAFPDIQVSEKDASEDSYDELSASGCASKRLEKHATKQMAKTPKAGVTTDVATQGEQLNNLVVSKKQSSLGKRTARPHDESNEFG